MSRLTLLIQGKIALALLGTVLFGGAAALLASASFSGAPNRPTTAQSQTYVNHASPGTGTPTPGSSTPGATSSTTATPGASPTATPTSTPTPLPPTPTPTTGTGQTTTLNGTVTSVNTSSSQFTIRVSSGATQTVLVQTQTTFQGACTSLSGLRTGWQVTVQGVYQPDGSFVGSQVISSSDT